LLNTANLHSKNIGAELDLQPCCILVSAMITSLGNSTSIVLCPYVLES